MASSLSGAKGQKRAKLSGRNEVDSIKSTRQRSKNPQTMSLSSTRGQVGGEDDVSATASNLNERSKQESSASMERTSWRSLKQSLECIERRRLEEKYDRHNVGWVNIEGRYGEPLYVPFDGKRCCVSAPEEIDVMRLQNIHFGGLAMITAQEDKVATTKR